MRAFGLSGGSGPQKAPTRWRAEGCPWGSSCGCAPRDDADKHMHTTHIHTLSTLWPRRLGVSAMYLSDKVSNMGAGNSGRRSTFLAPSLEVQTHSGGSGWDLHKHIPALEPHRDLQLRAFGAHFGVKRRLTNDPDNRPSVSYPPDTPNPMGRALNPT